MGAGPGTVPEPSPGLSILYQVSYECSVGVLWAAFHREGALWPVAAALQARARECQLFEGTGVSDIQLEANVNTRVGKGRVRSSGVNVDERWRFLTADCYWACLDADLSEWTAKSPTRTSAEALAGAMPVLTRLAWLGLAQVAVELGAPASRVAEFLAGSPVACEELAPRSKRLRRRPAPKALLEVQVLFRAEDPNAQMAERIRVGDVLRSCASRLRLGRDEGGRSSDEHFSFDFTVSNPAKAQAAFAAALSDARVDEDKVSFHLE